MKIPIKQIHLKMYLKHTGHKLLLYLLFNTIINITINITLNITLPL